MQIAHPNDLCRNCMQRWHFLSACPHPRRPPVAEASGAAYSPASAPAASTSTGAGALPTPPLQQPASSAVSESPEPMSDAAQLLGFGVMALGQAAYNRSMAPILGFMQSVAEGFAASVPASAPAPVQSSTSASSAGGSRQAQAQAQSLTCNLCGQSGHVRSTCPHGPNPSAATAPLRVVPPCYRCGRGGHDVAACV